MKSKKEKQEEKMFEVFNSLDKSVILMERHASRYDKFIDEAAIKGNDARAKQLIFEKISAINLADMFRTLKSNIQLGALNAKAISSLAGLPSVIEGCKGLLAESPNFSKLGKSIEAVFKDINATGNELNKLNSLVAQTFQPKPEGMYEPNVEENSAQFKAEYEAMLLRIQPSVTKTPVSKPTTDVTAPTGEVDFSSIMKEENDN